MHTFQCLRGIHQESLDPIGTLPGNAVVAVEIRRLLDQRLHDSYPANLARNLTCEPVPPTVKPWQSCQNPQYKIGHS